MAESKDTYRCAECGEEFGKGWNDEEAMAEATGKFGDAIAKAPVGDVAVVCDDCFKKMGLETAYLVWDTCALIEQQAQWLMEQENEREDAEPLSHEEALRLAGEDTDLLSMEWSDLCDSLTELMKELGDDHWRAEVKNFGWRKLDGHQEFVAETGQDMLRVILPQTDCTFKIYKRGETIAINNSHHDRPDGLEWYYIRPLNGGKDG